MTVTINGTTGYTGPIGAIGDLSTTGNTTLGDAAGDTVTINGSTTTFTQGTANGVAYLNGSKVLTTGSALVFDGTSLGIGIASPTQKLEVAGTSSATAIRVSTTGGAAAFYEASAQTGTVVSRLQSNVNAAFVGTLTNQPFFFQVNGSEVARFDNSGNFGLGVTPSAWRTAYSQKAIQVGPVGFISSLTAASNNNQTFVGSNFYTNTSNQNVYINSDYASLYVQYAGTHSWQVGPSGTSGGTFSFSQLMTLNASGYLAVGDQTSPTTRVDIRGTSANVASTVQIVGTGVSTLLLGQNADGGVVRGQGGNNCLTFWTGGTGDTAASGSGTERARIDSSGNLLVGRTSTVTFGSNSAYFQSGVAVTDGSTTSRLGPDRINFGGGQFYVLNGASVGVRLDSGSTSWSSQSDETTKHIIEPITNAVSKMASMRAVIGRYKTDEEGIRRSFLLAQDVQAVLPEAVSADDDGILSLRYTETIPLLVAAINELKAEFDNYKLTHP